jgi:hypothetical protein
LCPQVVICGAVPSMVRSVRLYNDCSSSDVRVDMKGRVLADDDKSDRFREYLVKRPIKEDRFSIAADVCEPQEQLENFVIVQKYY